MTRPEFLARVRERYDAPWLSGAVEEVDRQMETDGGHDFGHLSRVFANALHIVAQDDRPADVDAIVAAIIFHDVVNLPKNHPERSNASTLSAEVAVAYLADAELDLDLIHEAIRCHSFSAGLMPERYEAKVVADADNLESLGAFGIARTFYVAGHMGSSILHAADPDAEHRELDDRSYALDHFPCKLLKLRDQMHTPGGRALADQRHDFMLTFIEQLRREVACT